MKKIFYFIIPIVIIVVAISFFRNSSSEKSASSCILSSKEYLEADKKDATILDVRTQSEFDYGHLEGAAVIDIYNNNFKEKIGKLDKAKNYIVYCKTGRRSRSAVGYMLQSGFTNVCDVEGGINYLTRGGVKLVK